MGRTRLAISLLGSSALVTGLLAGTIAPQQASGAGTCARYYVATGDGVPAGKDADNEGSDNADTAYPNDILNDFLIPTPSGSGPWCLKNIAKDKTTTSTYVNGTGAQQAVAYNYYPTFVTIQLGRQNDVLIDSIDKCFKNIKHHEFTEANACALAILANSGAFTKLTQELTGILGKYQTMMSGNPRLIVAVLGYYNPYPHATTVATKIPSFCTQLTDNIPTCIARWILLPPALITLDQVVKKINSTIQPVVQRFSQGNQGKFVFVNPYDEMNDHCMTMKVTIRTKVYHPTNTVHDHNTSETNFGCDTTWIATDGADITNGPDTWTYLPPAISGVLIYTDHDTKKMGVNPNKDGHKCISKLIWAAVYQKLQYPANPIPQAKCS